jgi:methionine-gamma-lyase
MSKDPASRIQDQVVLGQFGEVNPSITDSSTFVFTDPHTMTAAFHGQAPGCFLYSRHSNSAQNYLSAALAAMEGTEAAHVTGSGMAAISCALLQICSAGDEIIASRTIYGGTYAFMQNILPRFGIKTHFINITDLAAVKSKINSKTKIIYSETMSNPLLEVADLEALRKICDAHKLLFLVDNTFSPLLVSPFRYGADMVLYSLTKYINGASDCVGGAICASKEFIDGLMDVSKGVGMLVGPVLDSLRAVSILKNIHTLHIRMQQHSKNAQYLAENLERIGLRVFYPGLVSHPQHLLLKSMLNPGYGFGGMLTLDAKDQETASKLIVKMQKALIGFCAVSLGFYKTLFSAPASSTSSEIPEAEQAAMGMTTGLVRFSIGLDSDIARTWQKLQVCLKEVGLI